MIEIGGSSGSVTTLEAKNQEISAFDSVLAFLFLPLLLLYGIAILNHWSNPLKEN